MLVIEAASASEVWSSAWKSITDTGIHRTHPRGDYTDSLHSVLSLTNPRQRWVASRSPGLNPAFALAEVIWIMRGRSDAAFLTTWNRALPGFTGDEASLYGAYGERIRTRFGFDQLEGAAAALAASPAQRQVVLQIWDPRTDFPTSDGRSRNADIPCNVTSMLKVADGRLEWMQIMRSNDLVLGLPYNLIQWTTIHEIIAGWMSLEVGSYVHVSDSLHIYDRDRDRISMRPAAPPDTVTDLRLPKSESDRVFVELERAAEAMSLEREVDAVVEIAAGVSTEGYADWALVLAAERVRRLGDPGRAARVLERVQDEQLRRASRTWHGERASAR